MGVKAIGAIMVLMAVVSVILPFLGWQLTIFSRYDTAGLGLGLLARGAVLCIGVVIYRIGDQLE